MMGPVSATPSWGPWTLGSAAPPVSHFSPGTVALVFSLRALWSLIYILCIFFFLKLPKILHKGKLCSLFYALSDEAKYPLIVDQRRRKNLEAIGER